jgi:8-oxo-dGTP diphosphatase
MQVSKFKLVPIVSLMIVRNNDVLLVQYLTNETCDGNYSLIGGHVDDNETIRCAAVREAYEETGLTVNPEDLEFMQVIHRLNNDGSERVHFYFATTKWVGQPYNRKPDKHASIGWFNRDYLPNPMPRYTHQLLLDYPNQEKYREFGWVC